MRKKKPSARMADAAFQQVSAAPILPEDNELLPIEEDPPVLPPQGSGKRILPWGKRKQDPPDPEALRQHQMIEFFDRVAPGVIQFNIDHYVLGNSFRCAWVVREFAPVTEDMALLRDLADKSGVSLRIYHSPVSAVEQRQIYERAQRKTNVEKHSGDFEKIVAAAAEQDDLISMRQDQRRTRDSLIYCTVYLELRAKSPEALQELKNDVEIELLRGKISVDKLLLRQREGCLCVMPFGYNALAQQFARVLPAKSAADLYPFVYSGKTDPEGLYIGKARYGTNLLVDLDLRDKEHTNGSCLLLGNSGEGKSYLMKILLTILRETGKTVMILDPEGEYSELCGNMGGCVLDMMSGKYVINPLEPRRWAEQNEDTDAPAEAEELEPAAFRKNSVLAQHISWLRDWIGGRQKDITSEELNTLEILLQRLYEQCGITGESDLSGLRPEDYPIMVDLFDLCTDTLEHYDEAAKPELFTKDCLRKRADTAVREHRGLLSLVDAYRYQNGEDG